MFDECVWLTTSGEGNLLAGTRQRQGGRERLILTVWCGWLFTCGTRYLLI